MTGIYRIPLYGVDRQYANLREEILDVTDKVYSSGKVLDGDYSTEFEEAIIDRVDRIYGVTVNSGTQALIFSLLAIKPELGHRNKVLIPSISFIATRNSVEMAGLVPEYCDVDPITGLIDIDKIDVPIDEVAAIMYVNLLGNVIDYDKLIIYTKFFTDRNIPIIEDAAQSFGASYKGIASGNLGTISCLSFDPTKNLNNYGSGGMVLTDDSTVIIRVVNFKDNGKLSGAPTTGTNSKMSEADCAQMMVKLKHFDAWQERRTAIAKYFTDNIHPYYTTIPTNDNVVHAHSKYVIHPDMQLSHRGSSKHYANLTIKKLANFGIASKITYPATISNLVGKISDGAYKFINTGVSLPIYPELADSEVEDIVKCLNDNI